MTDEDHITRELCYFYSDQQTFCGIDPNWELHNKDCCIHVCDHHILQGLQKCGTPTLVDHHVPYHQIKRHNG